MVYVVESGDKPRELILSFWGLNSDSQTWQQEPLPAEPFGLPTID